MFNNISLQSEVTNLMWQNEMFLCNMLSICCFGSYLCELIEIRSQFYFLKRTCGQSVSAACVHNYKKPVVITNYL